MSGCDESGTRLLRSGRFADTEACVGLWVEACAARDGMRVAGVAERARGKFDAVQAWIVAESSDDRSVLGFTLATAAGSGSAGDPADAAVLGLLAVDPRQQRSGLGAELLAAVTERIAGLGYEHVVLHALTDNTAAVRLYERAGWKPFGEPVEHSLLKKPLQTYRLSLHGEA